MTDKFLAWTMAGWRCQSLEDTVGEIMVSAIDMESLR